MEPNATLEERATNAETLEHIQVVRNLINLAAFELLKRGETHDRSKLSDAEVKTFVEFTPKLKVCTYGSEEYKGFLRDMAPALEHHYANNRHHPEHFKTGIVEMNLIDVLEMLLDWKAATMRHADGDLERSIRINTPRFALEPQLARILLNTARDLGLLSERQAIVANRPLQGDVYQHAWTNMVQDGCENAPFSSIGGLEGRADPKAPKYIAEADAAEYLRGYTEAARYHYGDDWQTCTFSWGPALTIGEKTGAV